MIFDALVAFILLKLFGVEGLQVLAAVMLVSLLRTCHNVNYVIGAMNNEYLEMLEKEEEEN
jgi:hypothetical protein